MKFHLTDIPGVIVVEPDVHVDERGSFFESYQFERYRAAGIGAIFVQDNHSVSGPSTLRGLHAQRNRPQAKLMRCIEGSIFDVAVDIRRGSPGFLHWVGFELSAENHRQLFIPEGFAHGFCVLGERAQIEYKCSDYYAPNDDLTIRWDDPDIGIDWPIADPVLSDKDRKAPTAAELGDRLPLYEGSIG